MEDGCVQGGFGSAVLEFMADNGYSARVKRLGIPDRIVEHGTQPELWAECGYDADAIYKTARSFSSNIPGLKSEAAHHGI